MVEILWVWGACTPTMLGLPVSQQQEPISTRKLQGVPNSTTATAFEGCFSGFAMAEWGIPLVVCAIQQLYMCAEGS